MACGYRDYRVGGIADRFGGSPDHPVFVAGGVLSDDEDVQMAKELLWVAMFVGLAAWMWLNRETLGDLFTRVVTGS
jgi:hypothetical protein